MAFWTAANRNQKSVPAAAPAQDAAGGEANSGLALRHLLRMIAYDPMATRAPQDTLERLRPFVVGKRLELRRRYEAGSTADAHIRGLVQLLDGAVGGLCHIARFSVDLAATSVVPPFAAVGVAEPEQADQTANPALDLLFLLPEDAAAKERSNRMVGFVLTGLSDLGFNVNHASCMPAGAALLAEALPALGARFRATRLIWGSESLYADFKRRLPAAAVETFDQAS